MEQNTEFVPRDFYIDNRLGRPFPRRIHIDQENGRSKEFKFVTLQELAELIKSAAEKIGPRDMRVHISESPVLKGPSRAHFEIERGWALGCSLSVDWGLRSSMGDQTVVGRLYPSKEYSTEADYERYEVVELRKLAYNISLSSPSCGGGAGTMLLKANILRDMAEFATYIEDMLGDCENIVQLKVLEGMQECKR
jgi:hypothetical protein